jgi:hypothetical protein
MTLLSALSLVADIVVNPPPPPPSHSLPLSSPLPYIVLAVVAIGGLWLLRRQRATRR